jgi:hypothetical protein
MADEQPNNPPHGLTLKAILEDLVERGGWEDLATLIPIRCFCFAPAFSRVSSSCAATSGPSRRRGPRQRFCSASNPLRQMATEPEINSRIGTGLQLARREGFEPPTLRFEA